MNQHKPSWSEVLRERYAPPPARAPAQFWAEFRRKAAGRKRVDAAPLRRLLPALAAAALIVGLLAVGVLLWGNRTDLSPRHMQAQGPDVDDVDVLVEHTSVIIFQDPQKRATVVWLSMQPRRI